MTILLVKRGDIVTHKKPVVPEAKKALEMFKMETAKEIGIDTNHDIDMGNVTSDQIGMMAKSGKLGGRMTRKMVQQAEQSLTNKNKNPMK